MRSLRKGQSTLEYIIILTAVIAVIIAVAKGALSTKLQKSYEDLAGRMETKVGAVNFGN